MKEGVASLLVSTLKQGDRLSETYHTDQITEIVQLSRGILRGLFKKGRNKVRQKLVI